MERQTREGRVEDERTQKKKKSGSGMPFPIRLGGYGGAQSGLSQALLFCMYATMLVGLGEEARRGRRCRAAFLRRVGGEQVKLKMGKGKGVISRLCGLCQYLVLYGLESFVVRHETSCESHDRDKPARNGLVVMRACH